MGLLALFTGSFAYGLSDGTVIQVFRPLAMSSASPLPPKDFYINLGNRDGIKVGDLLEVSRELPVFNALSGTPDRLMNVVLGELRIVVTGESDSVGRLEKQRPPEEVPGLEPASFILGDQVRLKTGLPFR